MYTSLKSIASQYFESFRKKDLESLYNLFDQQITLYDPIVSLVKGRDNVINVNKNIFDECNEIKFTKKDIFIDSTKMCAIAEIEFYCDEKKINVVDIITFNKSLKIISIKAYLDTKGL